MTDRLHTVILAAEKLSAGEQDKLASQIEALLPPAQHVGKLMAVDFSVFADMPDDAVEVLDRWRRFMTPTPPFCGR